MDTSKFTSAEQAEWKAFRALPDVKDMSKHIDALKGSDGMKTLQADWANAKKLPEYQKVIADISAMKPYRDEFEGDVADSVRFALANPDAVQIHNDQLALSND